MSSGFDFSDDFKRIQKDWIARVRKTRSALPDLVKQCGTAIANQWKLKNLLDAELFKTMRGTLPPNQQLVSIYFGRNAIYLRTSFMLAQEGSVSPCYDLFRTVFETITRSYLFALDPKSADLMYKDIEGKITPLETKELKRKYDFGYCSKQLWVTNRNSMDNLYRLLCRFSHPSIRSANIDWKYSVNSVKDCLQMVLSLSFGTIQVLMEAFPNYVKNDFKNLCRDSLGAMADQLKYVPIFVPDSKSLKPKMVITNNDILFHGVSLLQS